MDLDKLFGTANPPEGKKYDFRDVELQSPVRPTLVIIGWSAAGLGFGEVTFNTDNNGILTVDTEMMSEVFLREIIEYTLANCEEAKQHAEMFKEALETGRKDYSYNGTVRPEDINYRLPSGWTLKQDIHISARTLNPVKMCIHGQFDTWEIKDADNWVDEFVAGLNKTLNRILAENLDDSLKELFSYETPIAELP